MAGKIEIHDKELSIDGSCVLDRIFDVYEGPSGLSSHVSQSVPHKAGNAIAVHIEDVAGSVVGSAEVLDRRGLAIACLPSAYTNGGVERRTRVQKVFSQGIQSHDVVGSDKLGIVYDNALAFVLWKEFSLLHGKTSVTDHSFYDPLLPFPKSWIVVVFYLADECLGAVHQQRHVT